jgi:hypothetical protein
MAGFNPFDAVRLDAGEGSHALLTLWWDGGILGADEV